MILLKSLEGSRNIFLLIALAAGLVQPEVSPWTKHLVLPVLAVILTLSALEIDIGLFAKPRAILFPAFIGIIMNYIILGNILIGLSAFIVRDEKVWTGFILMAAVPPAAAVIPFSRFLNGNDTLSVVGTAGAYMGGLVVMPLIGVGLLGFAAFDPIKLFVVILELLVLPLCVSNLLVKKGLRERVLKYRRTTNKWGFFVIFYTLVGLNQNIFLSKTMILLPIAAISFFTTFLLGFLIVWIAYLFHMPRDTRTSLALLGTLKNQGLAGGLALTMFCHEAALPAAVFTIMMILYAIWLNFWKHLRC